MLRQMTARPDSSTHRDSRQQKFNANPDELGEWVQVHSGRTYRRVCTQLRKAAHSALFLSGANSTRYRWIITIPESALFVEGSCKSNNYLHLA